MHRRHVALLAASIVAMAPICGDGVDEDPVRSSVQGIGRTTCPQTIGLDRDPDQALVLDVSGLMAADDLAKARVNEFRVEYNRDEPPSPWIVGDPDVPGDGNVSDDHNVLVESIEDFLDPTAVAASFSYSGDQLHLLPDWGARVRLRIDVQVGDRVATYASEECRYLFDGDEFVLQPNVIPEVGAGASCDLLDPLRIAAITHSAVERSPGVEGGPDDGTVCRLALTDRDMNLTITWTPPGPGVVSFEDHREIADLAKKPDSGLSLLGLEADHFVAELPDRVWVGIDIRDGFLSVIASNAAGESPLGKYSVATDVALAVYDELA